MPKKICFITTVSLTLKVFVLETAKHLHEQGGYDITFICDEDKEFAKMLPEYINYIPVKMSRGINLGVFSAVKSFKKIFKEHKFDIVQYSTPNASLYASIAAKSAGVPIRLYGQWGMRFVGFEGIKRFIFKTLEKIVCKNSTHIRAVSHKNMEFAVREGLYPAKKARVLGYGGTIGVDLTEYPLDKREEWRAEKRAELGFGEAFVYGFSGRLSGDKGANELLSAFFKLKKEKKDIKLLIVGDYEIDKSVNPELVEKALNNKNVVFTGRIDKADMPKYYSSMDSLVHPTYREGFGMVLQEAAAMALPIITTDIPGAGEVMENGVSCILCESKSSEELYKAMSKISDKDIAEQLGQKARARVENCFERGVMLARQKADYDNFESNSRKVILTEIPLDTASFAEWDVDIIRVNTKTLKIFSSNKNVVAIIGCRASANVALKCDFPQLKIYQLTSAGFDGIDTAQFAKKGIFLCNAGDVYSVPIAETVVYGMLQYAKRYWKSPKKHYLRPTRGYKYIDELFGKRLLIMGCGRIGTAVADRVAAFGMEIYGYDCFDSQKSQYKQIFTSRKELLEHIGSFDYIVTTIPLMNETKDFLDAELFGNMKKTAVIVNVGRRGIFNENDFYTALKTGKIGGAVLDMFEKIPNPLTNKFRRLSNVLVLPGVSAISVPVKARLENHAAQNILKVLKGDKPDFIVK